MTVVILGGAQRGSRVPVLCPPKPHTDLERSWRDKAGDWSVSALTRNLLGSGSGGDGAEPSPRPHKASDVTHPENGQKVTLLRITILK